MQNEPSAEQVHEYLLKLVNPHSDGNTIKIAEEYLRAYIKNRQSVPVLFEIFLKSEIAEVRQLSGVLLGTLFQLYWARLPPDFKSFVKNNIFTVIAKEEKRLVLATIRTMLVTLMKSTIASSESWPEFMANLFALLQSPHMAHQELILGVFQGLLDNLEFVKEYRSVFGNLMQLIFSALDGQQPHMQLKIMAIKVLAVLLRVLDGEEQISHFRPLLPTIMNTIGTCISGGQEDEAVEALSSFDDIIESKVAFLFLKPELLNFMTFILEIGKSREVSLSVRQQALTALTWLAEFKPKNVLKYGDQVIPAFMLLIFQMLCEPEDEDADEDESSAYKFGSYFLGVLATHLSPTKIFEEALTFIEPASTSMNPIERKAAITALTVLSGGSCFVMQENLEDYMPFLYRALEDQDINVRRVACVSAGQMADNLQPEISEFSAQILPRLLAALNEADKVIQEKTCYALVTIVEKLEGDAILPFMEGALNRLMDLLRNSTMKEIQEMAITGISAIVLAAEDHILPYYDSLIETMLQLVQITDFQLVRLRGCALECAGVLALSLSENGKASFAPFLETFMIAAIAGLQDETFAFELRDYTFGFFARIAELSEEDFSVFLPDVVQLIKESFDSQSGSTIKKSATSSLVSKFVDDPTIQTDDNFAFSFGFIEGKIVSLNSLAVMAYTTKQAFIPYVNQMLPYVTFYLKYYQRAIRIAAIKPAEAMTIMIHKYFPPPRGPYEPGVPAEHQPLSPEAKTMLDAIMPRHIATITKDKDIGVVAAVLDSIKQIAKQMGPAAIEAYMPAIGDAVGSALHGETLCQQLFEDSDEDAISDISDEDDDKTRKMFNLTQSACEVTTKFCMIFQERWDYWLPLIQLVIQDLLSSSEDNVRQEAVGTLAECVELLEGKIAPHLDQFMKIGIKYMGDAYLPTASNASFMCGKLCEYCPAQSLQYYQELCEHSSRLLTQKKLGDAVDNTVGMLCRMIMANVDSVPIDMMLPAIIMNLPCRDDMEEACVVYPFLAKLVVGKHPAIAQYIPNIVHLFAFLVDTGLDELDSVAEEKKTNVMVHVARTFHFLVAEFPQQMQQILGTLEQSQCEKIAAVLATPLGDS